MKKRGIITAILTVSALMLTGCGGSNGGGKETEKPAATTAAVETNEAVKPVILAVSFGTSYNDTRDKTIGAIENAIADANPDYEVRRAFTSQIIIDKLKERDNLEIDNVTEALDRLVDDGVTELVVQPTHIMHGFEYDDLAAEVKKYEDKFDKVAMGEPLLTSEDDFTKVAEAVAGATEEHVSEGTAVVLMGHGTEHESNATYAKLQDVYAANGPENYFVGTVEAEPTLEDMVAAVKDGGYTRVVLRPFMVVAGDHANNDMAGDEDDSWKSVFESEGFEVECVLEGLGEIPEVQAVYVDHVKNAIDSLK